MKIYKTKVEYSKLKSVHIQTVNKREKIWRLSRIITNWKTIWYIDKVEVLKDYVNKL